MAKTLIIGGTGKVGELLVAMLLDRGTAPRVMSRSPERAAALPAGVQGVVCDMAADPRAAAAAFDGVETVFMLNRPTSEELVEGMLAVELGRRAGVRHFVYQSVHSAETMEYLPHVASKLAIERAVRRSGLAWTFIRPNYFFQNDLMARAGLERGLYTAPIGPVGVASVSAGDIAEVAALALTQGGHDGRVHNLVGPEVLTGEQCAATWSAVLGRQIRYAGDVGAWEAASRAFMPAWFNFDMGMMYRHIAVYGMPPEPGDVETLTILLNRPPRAYRDYVSEQAAAWGL